MARYLHKIFLTMAGLLLVGQMLVAVNTHSVDDWMAVETSAIVDIRFVDGRLQVSNLPESDKLNIYSVLGVNVATIDAKAGTNEYSVSLSKGLYIVKVGNVVKKIAVR